MSIVPFFSYQIRIVSIG